jgi:hypothetical protein
MSRLLLFISRNNDLQKRIKTEIIKVVDGMYASFPYPSTLIQLTPGSATIRDIAYRYDIAAKSISYRRIDTSIDSA